MIKKIGLILTLIISSLSANTGQTLILKGSGATFPYPLYKKWIEVYTSKNDIKILYEPVGSGKGISDLLNNRVDFGATDVFLNEKEMKNTKKEIVHIPTCIGAIVFTYNLPVNNSINLSKKALLNILTGKTTRWNDNAIKIENPGVKLPTKKITLIHRSDASGTTYILTKYLSEIEPAWGDQYGYGKRINWPAGIGVEGNKNIAKYVNKIPGSIGYISFTYAKKEKLPVAQIENEQGKYILPTVESISKSAEIDIPEDARVQLVASGNRQAYPICTFSYIIFYKDNINSQKYKSGRRFFNWMLNKGQKYNSDLYYAPVPKNVREIITNLLN